MDLDEVISVTLDDSDAALLKIADEGGAHEFSDKYAARMEELLADTSRPRKPRISVRRVLLVAAVVVAIAALASVASGAPQDVISRFFEAQGERHVVLQPYDVEKHEESAENGESIIPAEWGDYWVPKYVPEGYVLESANIYGREKKLRYTCNVTNTIEFSQHPRINNTLQDDEGTVVNGLFVGGFQIFAIEKTVDGITSRTIRWSDQNSTFSIEGTVSFDELIKIGESIVLVKGENHEN